MTDPTFTAWFFDFDGVLAESVDVKTRAFADLYEPYGPVIVEQVVAYHLKHGGLSRYEKFRHYHTHFLETELSAEEEKHLGDRFGALVEDLVVESDWVPGAQQLLDALHGHVPMFVVSGTPEEELRRIVGRRGMANYFEGVFGSPRGKGELISMIAAEHGLEPAHCVMIGDSITDFDGAKEAGVQFHGRVKSGQGNPFPPETPTHSNLKPLNLRALR